MKFKLLSHISKLRSRFFQKGRDYPYITNSQVQFPDLIHPSATILNSRLHGQVIVSRNTKVIDANIVGNVTIGRWSTFNGPNTDVYTAVNSVKIGNFVSIARSVSIQEYDHNYGRISSYFMFSNLFHEGMQKDIRSKGDILIGNDVWIGAQSVILSGAVISDGAVVGANSVVKSYIPPFAIAAGSPAKIVGYRFSNEISQRLIALEWWNWSEEKIKSNYPLFDGELTVDKLDQIR